MARKLNKESQAEQSERFLKAVQDMVDAGELSPVEAAERFERAMSRVLSESSGRSVSDS